VKHQYLTVMGFFLAVFVLGLPKLGLAHKPSDSYLSLFLQGEVIEAEWEIALRDLEFALGLDTDHDGAITWGELRAHHPTIADYAFSHLELSRDSRPCSIHSNEQWVNYHSDGAYTVLRFELDCPPGPAKVSLVYHLFFDLDPWHRGLLKIVYPKGVQSAVVSPEHRRLELNDTQFSRWRSFTQYWREGVWHIWAGIDHLLFLFALLLPAVLWWEAGRWREVESFRATLVNVTGVVTAFTVAHSITLGAAVLGFVSLPSRWVESGIAATVIFAAINNLYPFIHGKRWMIAFSLGLIHGFGFATVLTELGLPSGALGLALAGFNLGVETGQLAIVLAFLPIAYVLRGSWFYRRGVLQLGSMAVLVIGVVWFLERSLNYRVLPI
jgi:hypothetical protein